MTRKNKGKQKVEIVKIADKKSLQLTFSKRRSGLFKKASELSTLCGAEVAIVVFSPGNKVFCFGNPCVESVVDRFNKGTPQTTSRTMQPIEAHDSARIQRLNMNLTQVISQLEEETKCGLQLTKMRKDSQRQCWWQAPIDELNKPQLELLKLSLEELKKKVAKEAEKLAIQFSAPPPQFFQGNSSIGGEIQFPFDPTNINFNPNIPTPHTTMRNIMSRPHSPPPHQG